MMQIPTSDSPLSEDEVRALHQANRAGWNEGALHYTAALQETIEFLSQGKSNLHPIERRNLGDLRAWCQTAIHLQCASGRDTLSLLNEGVGRVTGVDISDVHIENARKISAALVELGRATPAEWIRCDVLDTPHELDGTADLVYTGRGALCWLHDIERYARVVARLLKPGGVYHVFDNHPVLTLFEIETETYVLRDVSYFARYETSVGWPSSYIGDSLGIPVEKQSVKYEKSWTIAEVVNALIHAGLTIELLGEHPDSYWDLFPNLKPELRGMIPLTFSLLARKT